MEYKSVGTESYGTEVGDFEFRCPKKSTVDAVLRMVDLLSQRYGEGVVVRAAQTLRVRMYLKSIEIRGETYKFHPVGDLLDYHGRSREALWELARNLMGSLDFASEVMFTTLLAASEDYKNKIDNKGQSQIQSIGTDMEQAAKKLVERKKKLAEKQKESQ